MARLVAATCPKCGAGVRLDPDKEYVTCSYCNVSSFIQTPRRPPTQQVVQTHQPVIHLENTARHISGCASAVISVGVLGAIGLALSGLFASQLPAIASRWLSADGGSPIPISVPEIASALTPPGARPEEDLFQSPSIVKTRLQERLGSVVSLKEMVLYPTYARVIVRDPKTPQNLDSYFYRYGQFQDPEPVRVSGSDRASLEKQVFALSEVDFAKIPALLKSALAEIGVDQGSVTHVIIERGGFGARAPVIRVYVNGPRDSGYVEYDLRGRRTRVAK